MGGGADAHTTRGMRVRVRVLGRGARLGIAFQAPSGCVDPSAPAPPHCAPSLLVHHLLLPAYPAVVLLPPSPPSRGEEGWSQLPSPHRHTHATFGVCALILPVLSSSQCLRLYPHPTPHPPLTLVGSTCPDQVPGYSTRTRVPIAARPHREADHVGAAECGSPVSQHRAPVPGTHPRTRPHRVTRQQSQSHAPALTEARNHPPPLHRTVWGFAASGRGGAPFCLLKTVCPLGLIPAG